MLNRLNSMSSFQRQFEEFQEELRRRGDTSSQETGLVAVGEDSIET